VLAAGAAGCSTSPSAENASCPTSSTPPSGVHRLYLAFGGVDLRPGPDDATTSTSGLITQAVAVPAFLAGDDEAPAKIALIVASVKQSLAPFDVEVVSERPAAGPYDMIVFGGSSGQVLGSDGQQFAGPQVCAGVPASQIGLVFEVRKPLVATAATAVGIYAVMHGAATTARPGDCLCLTDWRCVALATQCSFGAEALGSDSSGCHIAGSVNGVQEMIDAFGCRP